MEDERQRRPSSVYPHTRSGPRPGPPGPGGTRVTNQRVSSMVCIAGTITGAGRGLVLRASRATVAAVSKRGRSIQNVEYRSYLCFKVILFLLSRNPRSAVHTVSRVIAPSITPFCYSNVLRFPKRNLFVSWTSAPSCALYATPLVLLNTCYHVALLSQGVLLYGANRVPKHGSKQRFTQHAESKWA